MPSNINLKLGWRGRCLPAIDYHALARFQYLNILRRGSVRSAASDKYRLVKTIGSSSDALFKRLVLAQLCYPASKLRTTDYFAK